MNRSSFPPRSQTHQGWLKKKGKKRWFILQGNSLYWFAKEQKAVTFQHKDVKGCLELKGYAASIHSEKTHTFVVSNLRDMNYYELTAASAESMNQWLEYIKAAIQASETESPNDQQFEKRGVLVKKGQERLFVLKNDSLMWFLSKTGAEKKAKGSLPLKDVTMKRGPKGYSFVLQPRVGKSYTLFASSQSECDDWMAAVNKVIDTLNSTQGSIKSGWLEKKGQKRYFVIKNGKLLWFKRMQKDDDVEANGYLLLDSCTVAILPPVNGRYSIHIVSQITKERTKRDYTLYAPSEAECSDWVTAMVSAGAKASAESINMTAQSRRMSVQQRVSPPPDSLAGAYLAGGAETGSAVVATGAAPQGDFLIAEKSGWLEKKGKRRWFVLANGQFAWYDQPKQHEKGDKANGFIVVKDAAVASIGEIGNGYFAFTVYTKDAEYLLQAASLNEMEDWVVVLVLAGASPENKTSTIVDEGSTTIMARPDSLPENDKHGWMEKKGRKRWFVLRNGHLYWYKAVQENESGLKTEAAGSLDLKECTVKKLDEKLKGKSALLLSSSSRGDYLLLHQDEEEISSWVKLIIEKGGATKYKPTGVIGTYGQKSSSTNYFGISLQQLLAKEGNENGGIPILVRKCVEHIRQHGMEAEGIFRVSGEQIDIVALKQEFESSSDIPSINFPNNIDVHAVSGLLKMFFRELNPPLMTFELYSDFMSAAGCVMSEIKALISRLPHENKTLLKYLLDFLYDVSQYGDVNKMRPMNLAIVFSPNLFRSDKSAFEVLANSSNAASVTQFIIANARELFPDAAGTAPADLPPVPGGLSPDFATLPAELPPLPAELPPLPAELPPLPPSVGNRPQLPPRGEGGGGSGMHPGPVPHRPVLPPYGAPPQLHNMLAAELAQRQKAAQ